MICSLNQKYSLFSLLREKYTLPHPTDKSLPKVYLIMASDPQSKMSFEVFLHLVYMCSS